MSEYEIRAFRPGDQESLLASFNDVFARTIEGFVPRTMAQWEWGYMQNPAGQRIMLGVKDGEVVERVTGVVPKAQLVEKLEVRRRSDVGIIREGLDVVLGVVHQLEHLVDAASGVFARKGLRSVVVWVLISSALSMFS